VLTVVPAEEGGEEGAGRSGSLYVVKREREHTTAEGADVSSSSSGLRAGSRMRRD